MKDSLAAFLRHLSLEKDASPHTLRSYRTDLLEFAQYAGPGEPSTWLGGVDTRTIRGYLAHLHARALDSATIARKLAAVRSWFRFLVRRGVLERNVAREVRGPRPPRKLVSFLPIDEATALMDAKAPSAAARARDTAVLELLYATGLRVSELAGLDLDDVDRSQQTVRVLGKGKKERIVPYGRRAAGALAAHLGGRRGGRGPLFENPRGARDHPAREPAHAAPHVRDPSAGRRRRSSSDPGAARPQPPVDDPALHPRGRRPAHARVRRRPSARPGKMIAEGRMGLCGATPRLSQALRSGRAHGPGDN